MGKRGQLCPWAEVYTSSISAIIRVIEGPTTMDPENRQDFFSCGHRTLHLAVSVSRSVGRWVGRLVIDFFFEILAFSHYTAPAQCPPMQESRPGHLKKLQHLLYMRNILHMQHMSRLQLMLHKQRMFFNHLVF